MFRVFSFVAGVGLSLAVCCAATAQSTITGTLRQKRGDDLSPIRHCTVYAASHGKGPLVAEYPDSQGRFRLEFPPDSRIVVGTICAGFVLLGPDGRHMFETKGRSPLPEHDCSRPGLCAELELVAEPLGVVEGEVVDDSGMPLEGIFLALRQEIEDGMVRTSSATSDDRGHFRFFHVAPGSHELLRMDRGSQQPLMTEGGGSRLTVGAGEVISAGRIRVPSNGPIAPMMESVRTPPPEGPAELDALSDGMIEVLATDLLGSPVKGAVISVQGGPRSDRPMRGRATTDAAGLARFAGLPNGSYWLEAQMAGYSLPTRVRTLEIRGPGARAAVKVQLARRPVLTGHVVDEQGVPMPDTRIQLFELTTGDGEPTVAPSWSTTTDDRGFYRLSVPEPGRYWVMATHMELSFPRGSAPRPTGSVFFPNSPDMLSSLPADLSFDQADTVFDFTLPPAPRTELAAGLLSGRGGWPCAQCAYSVRMIEGEYDYEVIGGSISGGLAGFEYRGIPAGQYRIFVEDQAEDTLGWWAIEEVSLVEDRPVALAIETKPPVALAGRLTLEDPPSEWTAEQRDNADAVQVQLTQAGNPFFTVHRASGTRTQLPPEAVEFVLGPLPPEKFRLEVWAQGTDAYLAGVAQQGRPLPAPMLDLSQPGDWTNLELRVRFDMARPVIRIPALSTRGHWWTMQRVVLVPDRDQNPFGHVMEGYCGHDGSCDISPVPPGRYWAIVVQQSPGSIDFRDIAVRSKLAQWGREIDLTPGENSMIELKPVPQKALDGI